MARIKVTPEQLMSVGAQFQQISSDLCAMDGYLTSSFNGLDLEGNIRSRAASMLGDSRRCAASLAENASALSVLIKRKAEAFARSDGQSSEGLSAISTYLVNDPARGDPFLTLPRDEVNNQLSLGALLYGGAEIAKKGVNAARGVIKYGDKQNYWFWLGGGGRAPSVDQLINPQPVVLGALGTAGSTIAAGGYVALRGAVDGVKTMAKGAADLVSKKINLGSIGFALSAGIAIYDNVQDYGKADVPFKETAYKVAVGTAVDVVGTAVFSGALGAVGSVALGAAGGALLGPVGAVVGAKIGGVLGSMAGSWLYKNVVRETAHKFLVGDSYDFISGGAG